MPTQALHAIIYDFDGVMVDSFKNCFEAYKLICDYVGHRQFTFEEFKEWYDPEWMNNLTRLTKGKELNDDDLQAIKSIYLKTVKSGTAPFYPGTLNLIHFAKSHTKQAIVSGGYAQDIQPRLRSQNIESYFPILIDHQDGYIKPHPRPMEMAIDRLQIMPDKIMYIGDMAVDVAFARNAHIGSVVLCANGWESMHRIEANLKKYQVKPDHLVTSQDELLALVKTYNQYL